MKAKIKKLQRDPIQFFKDSKLKRILFPKGEKIEIKNKTHVKKTNSHEPLLFGKVSYKENKFDVHLYKKNVINEKLGFSSLLLTDDNEQLLIKQPYISVILKEKNFIGFRDKSLYFLREDSRLKNIVFPNKKINELFLTNKKLRQDSFHQFRNIITVNTLTPTFMILRQSNPKLRTICIVDNEEALRYLNNYKEFVDVLIYKKGLDIAVLSGIPRIVEYKDTESFMNVLQLILIDNSYKKDDNVLLPILTTLDNMEKIDCFNDNGVDGLIRLEADVKNVKNFDELIEQSEIIEFYLKENIYSLYKDAIFAIKNQNDLKVLLKRALKDGVHFEEI